MGDTLHRPATGPLRQRQHGTEPEVEAVLQLPTRSAGRLFREPPVRAMQALRDSRVARRQLPADQVDVARCPQPRSADLGPGERHDAAREIPPQHAAAQAKPPGPDDGSDLG